MKYLIRFIYLYVGVVIWGVHSCIHCYKINDTLIDNNQQVINARVLVFLTFGDNSFYDYKIQEPAISFALEKVQRIYSKLKISALYYNLPSHCTAKDVGAIMAKEHYSHQKISAVFGPMCSYALDHVARLATSWNIPVYSSGGMDIQFDDKADFPTLTRINSNTDSIANFGKLVIESHKVSLNNI